MSHHREVKVTVEALGSGTAFVRLLDGSADIGASSRPASQKELEQASTRGVTLREFVLGYDGIAVIARPSNPLNSLTISEISDLFTGKLRRWREPGGENRAVRRIYRPNSSGTHAFFKEKALRKGNSNGVEEFASDTQFMEDNNDILAAVANDPAAVAYVGLGWVDTRVKALAVANSANQPAVRHNLDTIRNGTHPLYRPLLLYTRGAPTGSTRFFLQFALSDAGERSSENGHSNTAPAAASARLNAARRVLSSWKTSTGRRATPAISTAVTASSATSAPARTAAAARTPRASAVRTAASVKAPAGKRDRVVTPHTANRVVRDGDGNCGSAVTFARAEETVRRRARLRRRWPIGARRTPSQRPHPAAGYPLHPALPGCDVKDFVRREIERTRRVRDPFLRAGKLYYLSGLLSRLLGDSPPYPRPRCVALRSHLRILPDGSEPVCQFNGEVMGNLRLTPPDEVLHSSVADAARRWVDACPGCWAECEVIPNAIFTGDIVRGLAPERIFAPSSHARSTV